MDMRVMGQGGQTNLNVTQSDSLVIESVNSEKKTVENDGKSKDKDIQRAVDKLNDFLKGENTYAEYKVHDKFGDVMIKIIDNDTKEIILEVPPKKILDMIANLCEAVGVVLDKKA
ncbi:flagellar protein FlaG [Clostridium paraputrificum]|uniref:flagellar protein FlaG n=1 Tax=Clostridium TaxID=1485 RepID=UPI003D33895C